MTRGSTAYAGHRGLVHDRRRAGPARLALHDVRHRCSSRRPRGSAATRPAPARSSRTTELSRRGTVWSYTDAQYQPPPPYIPRSDPYVPFALAAVELPEGIVVLGQVADGYGVDDLQVGTEVELVVETLYTDETASARSGAGSPWPSSARRPTSEPSDVAVLGVGMHPWGKWGRNFVEYGVARRARGARRRRRRLAATSSSSSAARPSATATPATSPARRSPRRSAGTAPASPRRTPPAPPGAQALDTARARILAGLCDVALVVGADTTPKGFLAPERRRALGRPRLAALPPARRDQPDLLRALRPPAHGPLRRDRRRTSPR